MTKVYLNGAGCVSAQDTFEGDFFTHPVREYEEYVLPVSQPPYKEFIPAGMIRRMSPAVKNAAVASALALKEAGNPNLDAIITGTGLGCIKDSEVFLSALVDNDEQFLTPTAFIQSTHNTVAAQIALSMSCKSYNFTYVNGGVSFESALLDAKVQFAMDEVKNVLIGGVEEKAEVTYKLFGQVGLIKTGENTPGATYSEGASFFVLSDSKSTNTYAEVVGVRLYNQLEPKDIKEFIDTFLAGYSLGFEDIDALVLGISDDTSEHKFYDGLDAVPTVHYKHLIGEHNSASAFGLWVGGSILRSQEIPAVLKLNGKEKGSYQNVLLYNQYRGKDFSLVLLKNAKP